MFSRRDLARIITPLIIQQLLAQFVGMADSIMVSSVGEAAVSGVALVDSINSLFITIFTALTTGGSVVTSQFLGAKDYVSANKSAKQLIYTTLTISLSIMTFSLLFRKSMLRLIFGAIDENVMECAQTYFLYTSLSFPFFSVYSCCAATFRSMGNSKISMYASFLVNIINVIGNSLLIYVFKLGVAGAAIATLVSRMSGMFLIMFLLRNKDNPVYVRKLFPIHLDFKIIKRILNIGVPNGIENGMFQFGRVILQSMVSTMGTYAIAANAVAHNISGLQSVFGVTIGLASITIVGQCVGANDKEQAKKYAKKLLRLTYICVFCAATTMMLLSKQIIDFYNLSPQSATICHRLLIMYGVVASLIWPLSFTLPNIFRAASDVKFPLMISLISMWLFRISLCFVFVHFGFGIYGIWIAMFCDWVFRALVYTTRFVKGTWLTKYKALK